MQPEAQPQAQPGAVSHQTSATGPATPIVREEARVVFENRFVRLYNDAVSFHGPDGTVTAGTYLRLCPGAPDEEGRFADGVAILPIRRRIHPTGRTIVEICLVRPYRYALGAYRWEIPRGFAAPGDSVQESAARELYEETGTTAIELVDLGRIAPDSGLLESRVHLVLAELPVDAELSPVDTDEITGAVWLPAHVVIAMAAEGEIEDGFTIAALFRARLTGLL